MKNKNYYLFLIIIILFSCSKKLPHNLEIAFIHDSLIYRIQDKSSGSSVLEPGDYIGFNDTNPKVERLLTYSINDLGFIVFLKSTNNSNYYVLIKPKPEEEQIYSETLFDYIIYSENDYKKLNLKDNWHKIPFNSNSLKVKK